MEYQLNKIRFISKILEIFHQEKLNRLARLLEELNSGNPPETRFAKAELRRLAMFEEKFLRLIETYPDPIPQDTFDNPRLIYDLITGDLIEF